MPEENKDTKKNVGTMIVWILHRRHLQQMDLSRATGISRSTISGWRTQNKSPELKNLEKICRYLDVSADYLLNGDLDADPHMSFTFTGEETSWLSVVHRIPPEKRQMCMDFLLTHATIPEKYADRKKA